MLKETQLASIARASVQLGGLGPRLATFAADMEIQARTQAENAANMAETMNGLVRDLEAAVAELRASSGQMRRALETVDQIAGHTRLISINAGIEAARAGLQGRAFAVIVDEVKQLADRTGETTLTIENRMQDFAAAIARMAALASAGESSLGPERRGRTAEAVNRQVRGMADSAGLQLGHAESVHSLGTQINRLTETLLLAVGKFRFDAHLRAQGEVAALGDIAIAHLTDRGQLEAALEAWLQARPHFELAYVTDPRGRQIIDNIGWKNGRVERDWAGFGRDWSERPWYGEALNHAGVCSTDVYRSTATGDFCFTIAVALRNAHGATLGVLGSDVNFQRLVGE